MTKVYPRVIAVPEKVAKGEKWLLVVTCPYCSEIHKHGAGVVVRGHDAPIDEMYGMRQSLCFPGGAYVLCKEGEEIR